MPCRGSCGQGRGATASRGPEHTTPCGGGRSLRESAPVPLGRGPVAVENVRRRYAVDADWIARRLDEWARAGKLVRGSFGGDASVVRYCSRRLLEEARRRELADARRQVQPVEQHAFAYFLQRWQHVDPGSRWAMDGGRGAPVYVGRGLPIAWDAIFPAAFAT